jgi:cytochrome c oxidase cbb3-type subunit 3
MTDNKEKKQDVDKITGVETTGHEWDGLKELNNPLPRWWVWVWIVTIIWGVGYMIIYPAFPTLGTDNQGGTTGTSGRTQYHELAESQAEIAARQAVYLETFENASYDQILSDPELYQFAMAGGATAFKENCAQCHGTGAEGGRGYPNLNDDDWLWGGKVTDIEQTLQHGIRVQGSYDTRLSQMPAFGRDKLLTQKQINDVTDYVMALGDGGDLQSLAGHQIFQENCASCHGTNGRGMHEFGAPNLADGIWLYGGERKDVYETIVNARAGMMPAWNKRLPQNTIRQISLYVHQLGGGEE